MMLESGEQHGTRRLSAGVSPPGDRSGRVRWQGPRIGRGLGVPEQSIRRLRRMARHTNVGPMRTGIPGVDDFSIPTLTGPVHLKASSPSRSSAPQSPAVLRVAICADPSGGALVERRKYTGRTPRLVGEEQTVRQGPYFSSIYPTELGVQDEAIGVRRPPRPPPFTLPPAG